MTVPERIGTDAAIADRGSERSRPIQKVCLIGGIAVILAAVSPPVDEFVDRAFSAHMLQHMVLTNIGAVLLAVAWPLVLGRWEQAWFARGLNWLARPAPAVLILLSSGVLWFWHIPDLYDFALGHNWAHALEHLMFIGAFLLFWRPVMSDPMTGRHLRSNEGKIFYLSIGMLATGILGAYIMFANHLLYPHYADSHPGGRTALEDQQLGGGIMLLFGVITTILVAIASLRDEPGNRADEMSTGHS